MTVSVQRLSAATLAEDQSDGERFLDVCYELRVMVTEEVLTTVGGRWDRVERKFTGERARRGVVLRVRAGQVPAARWFVTWLRGYLAGGKDAHATECRRIWSVLFHGGRRGGKTDLAVKCLLLFAVATRGSMVWACSPTMEETQELREVVDRFVPAEWAVWREEDARYALVTGSRLWMRTGYKPKRLKRGRVDLVLLNEAQMMDEKVFVTVRPATADTGGLTICAANPPDEPIGEWVSDFHDEARAGTRHAREFYFDPELNTEVRQESLTDLKSELDEETYLRDVKGEFRPIGVRVLYTFSSRLNVYPAGFLPRDMVPEQLRGDGPMVELANVTEAFTRLHFGRPFKRVIGIDVQRTPHMAAVEREFFADPWGARDAVDWTVDEHAPELADEDDLCDILLEQHQGGDVAIVLDASGWWQDADRTKGGDSAARFRARGFGFIFKPDRETDKNPSILESCKVCNARCRTADERRHSFVDPSCLRTIEALAKYPLKHGAPDRRSNFAHVVDAWRYPMWRIWPRKARRKSTGLTVQRDESSRAAELREGGMGGGSDDVVERMRRW